MRVVTLLPAATEIVAALGAVGRARRDLPRVRLPRVASPSLPRVTATPHRPRRCPERRSMPRCAGCATRAGRSSRVDAEALRRLAPDLIITQDLCEVCAVADGEVHRLAARSLRPTPRCCRSARRTVAGIDGATSGASAAPRTSGPAGEELVAGLGAVSSAWRDGSAQPRPACSASSGSTRSTSPATGCPSWWRPPGGRDVGAAPGQPFGPAEAGRSVGALRAGSHRGHALRLRRGALAAASWTPLALPRPRRVLASAPVWLLDGNAYTSRPGPRVVDGAERLRAAIEGRGACRDSRGGADRLDSLIVPGARSAPRARDGPRELFEEYAARARRRSRLPGLRRRSWPALPGGYAPPGASPARPRGGAPAGCVALRPLEPGCAK